MRTKAGSLLAYCIFLFYKPAQHNNHILALHTANHFTTKTMFVVVSISKEQIKKSL